MFAGAGVILYFYIKFCLKYTHVCTMSIRYIIGAVYIGCLAVGAAITSVQQTFAIKHGAVCNIITKIMTCMSALYAAAVIVLIAGMEWVLF